MTKKYVRPVIIMIATFALAAVALVGIPVSQAEAIAAYNPQLIITDSRFYTSNPTMSVNDIQNFLNSQGKNCKPRGGTPCLKDYRQTTYTRPADNLCPKTYQGAPNESAAQIIYKTSVACNIAPQVILVTLQKEQSLVTSVIRSNVYNTAMGYGCPDGAACSAKYFGLHNQIYNAAHQFQRYRLKPGSFNFAAGRTSWIGYNPKRSCGGSYVKVANAATAALYNYTPYQPGGRGSSCQTYGNLNFHRYYSTWFGDPRSNVSAPAPKPAQPVAKVVPASAATKATGTVATTTVQGNAGKASVPAPETTKPVTISLADKDGKALTAKGGVVDVSDNAQLNVTVNGFDKDQQPVATLNNKAVELPETVKADQQGKVTFTITTPKEQGKVTLAVHEKVEGQAKPAKNASVTLNVVQNYTPLNVTVATKDGTAVPSQNGTYYVAKKTPLKLSVTGFEAADTPIAAWSVDGKQTPVDNLAVTKTDKAVEVAVDVPDTIGNATLTLNEKPAANDRSHKRAALSFVVSKYQPLFITAMDKDNKKLELTNGELAVDTSSEVKFSVSGFAKGDKPKVTFGDNAVTMDDSIAADEKGVITFSWKAPEKPMNATNLVVSDKLPQGQESTKEGTLKVRVQPTLDSALAATTTTKVNGSNVVVNNGEKVDPNAPLTYTVSTVKTGEKLFVAVDGVAQKVNAVGDANRVATFTLPTATLSKDGNNTHQVIMARSQAELDAKIKAKGAPDVKDHTYVFTYTVAARPTAPTVTAVKLGSTTLKEGSVLKVGDVVSIDMGGFEPGESVKGQFHSKVVPMSPANATKTASAFGWVSIQGETIPALEPGQHHIVAQGSKAQAKFAFMINKEAAPAKNQSTLAQTGSETGPIAALAILLLGTGYAAFTMARRNRPITVN